MTSSWANSWLGRWANSWGALFTPPYIPSGLRIVQALFQERGAAISSLTRELQAPIFSRDQEAALELRTRTPELLGDLVESGEQNRNLGLSAESSIVELTDAARGAEVNQQDRLATAEAQDKTTRV